MTACGGCLLQTVYSFHSVSRFQTLDDLVHAIIFSVECFFVRTSRCVGSPVHQRRLRVVLRLCRQHLPCSRMTTFSASRILSSSYIECHVVGMFPSMITAVARSCSLCVLHAIRSEHQLKYVEYVIPTGQESFTLCEASCLCAHICDGCTCFNCDPIVCRSRA
jgi:hypothetical protein